MNQILVYADSLTWGIIPNTRQRLAFHQRWPGVLEHTLNQAGQSVRVIENCLNGRRTVWSDPFKAGRDGSDGLQQVIEMHSPLQLVILMLGTNDFQCTHNNNAWLSAQGVNTLITQIKTAPIEPGMSLPQMMVVVPPAIQTPKGDIAHKFDGASARCTGLVEALALIATQQKVHYFDAGQVVQASQIDGIHLDAPEHLTLGKALASKVMDARVLLGG